MDSTLFFSSVAAVVVVLAILGLALMAGLDERWHRGAHIALTIALLLVAIFALYDVAP